MQDNVGAKAAEGTTRGAPPYYAYLEHPDGRWYAVWMTQTQPRTERGHPWHVHADYSREDRLHFTAQGEWYTAPYGMGNWDFDSVEDAIQNFLEDRLQPRLEGGYQLVQGYLPQESA